MLRKVLVMNSAQDGKIQTKGLLSLEAGNNLSGRLRVYDIEKDTNLVIKIGENSLIFDSISQPNNFLFETVYHSLSTPICAIVTDGKKVLAFGKTDNFDGDFKDLLKDYEEFENSFSKQPEVKEKTENNELEIDDFLDNHLNEEVEIPYVPHIQSTKNEKSVSEDLDANHFFEMVKPQVDNLFSKSERFVELEEKISDTEWVKVPYLSEENDHYIIGKIYSDNEVTHLCYGIPAKNKNAPPPANLEKYCQWLPLDVNDPQSEGYFVMYQDAKTGENVVL